MSKRAQIQFEAAQDNFLSETNALNADINKWNISFVVDLKDMIGQLSKSQKKELINRLKYQYKFQNDLLFKIQYQFPKSAIYWSKGAGKGYVVQNGNIQKLATNKSKSEKSREEHDWFNPTLKQSIENLAAIVANHYGSLMANTYSRLKIK